MYNDFAVCLPISPSLMIYNYIIQCIVLCLEYDAAGYARKTHFIQTTILCLAIG